jgi:uncharacterized damage-inducible protein DinB
MDVSEYRNLLSHMEWADSLIWKAVLRADPLRRDQPTRERLYHSHSTQWVYLQVWRREQIRIPELATFPDLEALSSWARAYYRDLATYADALQGAALHRTIEFPWATQLMERFGTVAPATLAETILQVVLHTTHHRAQVASTLRGVGHAPPMSDFIACCGWAGLRHCGREQLRDPRIEPMRHTVRRKHYRTRREDMPWRSCSSTDVYTGRPGA